MASKKEEGDKHHYIPKFYLKQWATDSDHRLCQYSRPYRCVTANRRNPDAVAYIRGLNTFHALPPDAADFLEKQFFQQADDKAAKAFELILNSHTYLEGATKSAWSRFIMTPIYRTPEGMRRVRDRIAAMALPTIDELAARYEELRSPADPLTFDEFRSTLPDEQRLQAATQRLLTRVMDSGRIGNILNSMIFVILTPNSLPFPLLTSDRPMTIINGFGQPNSCVIMPISSARIFVAAKDRHVIDRIAETIHVRLVNCTVVKQARDYVYGIDDQQLRFVSNRLGRRARWGPFE